MKKWKEACSLLIGIGLVTFWMTMTDIGCPIKALTGISCAGCGMTRALIAAFHLQFNEAFFYHPLFWMCPIIIALYLFWEKISSSVQKLLFYLIIASFCATYILRLFFIENDIVVIDVKSGWIAILIQKIFRTILNI